MTSDARELARVRNPVLLLSGVTWIVLLAEPRSMVVHAHLHPTTLQAMPLRTSVEMLLAMNPPALLMAGWALMLSAMMLPVLIPPIRHIRRRSFARRRPRSIALFVAGYGAVWMMAGVALLAIELAVRMFAPQSYLPAVVGVLIASVWQFSPIKQRCLNRCHANTELAAFGAHADLDVLSFGLTHGLWCASSCWALMLFPMLLPRGHVAAMVAVALLIFSERLERPRPPSWRWRGIGAAKRMVIAQARMRHLSSGTRWAFTNSGV